MEEKLERAFMHFYHSVFHGGAEEKIRAKVMGVGYDCLRRKLSLPVVEPIESKRREAAYTVQPESCDPFTEETHPNGYVMPKSWPPERNERVPNDARGMLKFAERC